MTLVTRSSWATNMGESEVGRKKMELKKYVWINDAGKTAETANRELPKGWVKGKLLGAKGQEVSDAQTKEWGLGNAKAKAPAENKGK
jgi:hypothetical protein